MELFWEGCEESGDRAGENFESWWFRRMCRNRSALETYVNSSQTDYLCGMLTSRAPGTSDPKKNAALAKPLFLREYSKLVTEDEERWLLRAVQEFVTIFRKDISSTETLR